VPGRLVLVATTHRVAPGLLSLPAWQALTTAGEVYAASADHPTAATLDAAGIVLRVPAASGDPELAKFLVDRAGSAEVVWMGGSDGDPGLAQALATVLADPGRELPLLEVVAGSWDLPGARLLDLVAVMDRLRSPGGCPWDAGQTHASLVPYLLEEAYEAVETVETGDLTGLREEMGDVLLQVVFHARIAQEHPEDPWSVDDVAGGIVDKLVARHPHVFGADGASPSRTAEQVEESWDELKRVEKGRSSAVDGVPLAQPGLALAAKLLARARRAGVEVPPAASGPTPSLDRALDELTVDLDGERLGALLLSLVDRAQLRGLDAEAAMRAAARGLADRVRAAEALG
jgi:XTP/dITP diphosphohydrolase